MASQSCIPPLKWSLLFDTFWPIAGNYWGSDYGLNQEDLLYTSATRAIADFRARKLESDVDPNSGMFRGLVHLRELGFAPTGVLDVGAYEGHFTRGLRQIFEDAHIVMIDALAEKEPLLKNVCVEVGNAEYVIALLGESEIENIPFFVVNTDVHPSLVKTGSSKYEENAAFPQEARPLQQRTLGSIVADRERPFQFLKLDVQGAELDVLRGLGHHLSMVEVILMEMSLVDYNKGAPLIDTVLSALNRMGFVLYDILEEHRFLGGRLFQIDGLFVRPSFRLRPQPPFIA